MPTYEYRCQDCGHVFDRVEHVSEHTTLQTGQAPNCPKCGSKKVESVLTPFFAKTSRKS